MTWESQFSSDFPGFAVSCLLESPARQTLHHATPWASPWVATATRAIQRRTVVWWLMSTAVSAAGQQHALQTLQELEQHHTCEGLRRVTVVNAITGITHVAVPAEAWRTLRTVKRCYDHMEMLGKHLFTDLIARRRWYTFREQKHVGDVADNSCFLRAGQVRCSSAGIAVRELQHFPTSWCTTARVRTFSTC